MFQLYLFESILFNVTKNYKTLFINKYKSTWLRNLSVNGFKLKYLPTYFCAVGVNNRGKGDMGLVGDTRNGPKLCAVGS